MSRSTIRIAQAQFAPSLRTDESLQKVERLFAQAHEQGADLLALPEMFCCPYDTTLFAAYAEFEGGRVWKFCSELAKKYGMYLSAGSVPEDDNQGHLYNTGWVFDRDGKMIARHRKMHLFDIDIPAGVTFRESDSLDAGDTATVFDTEFGCLGLCVCYDIRFPELLRLMTLAGARMVICPAAFNTTTGPLHWELVFRSQAVLNQVAIVGTAPALNTKSVYHSWGHSIIVDAWANVISQLDEHEALQVTDLDLDTVDVARRQLPLLRQRRTDAYRLVSIDGKGDGQMAAPEAARK